MKSVCAKTFIALSILIILSASSARADIPFTQATGMYSQTLDDRKKFSPFWAMVAIHGKMLERIRFYGNYATQPNLETEEVEGIVSTTVDQGRDKIAELIKRLFNSPDGVQFVATTYEADPVGNLSRNLPRINDIIDILINESDTHRRIDLISAVLDELNEPIEKIPAEKLARFKKLQEQQIAAGIINRNKELIQHDINSLKQNLHQGIDEKTIKTKEMQNLKSKKYPELISLAKEMKIDGIEDYEKIPKKPKDNLISNLVKKDLEKKLLEKMTDQELRNLALEKGVEFNDTKWQAGKENPLKNLIADELYNRQINNLNMQALRNYASNQNLTLLPNKTEPELIQSFAAQRSETEISEVLSRLTQSNEEIVPQLKANNNAFARLLVEAYDVQKDIANPSKPDKYLYPENIVITALLGFFIKVADDSKELAALTSMMKPGYRGSEKPFDKEQYEQLKKQLIDNQEMPNLQLLKDPELAFLMVKGYLAFEYPYAEPITYSGYTPYKNNIFPDCGETSLRNVLGIFLSAWNQGKISENALESLTQKIKPISASSLGKGSPFQNMVSFFKTHPDMTLGGISKRHTAWAQVVSNLNNGKEATGLNDVYYGLSSQKGGPVDYEIKAHAHDEVMGIINMLNVIAKLIPDEELQKPWSENREARYEEIAAKLTRFCELLSREDLEISWSNKEYQYENKDYKRKIVENEFIEIVFTINNKPVFNWEFNKRHFQLDSIPITENDWRSTYREEEIFTPDNFRNEWMASLFRSLPVFLSTTKESTTVFYPLSLVYSSGLKDSKSASSFIGWVLRENKAAYKPLSMRWIHKSIPLNDASASWDLWNILITTNNAVNLLQELFKEGEIIKTLRNSWKYGLIEATKYGQNKVIDLLLKHGAPLESELTNFSPDSPLKVAIINQKIDTVQFLLNKGANVNSVCDIDQNTPLYIAASKGYDEIANLLIEKGAELNSHDTKNPLVRAIMRNEIEGVKFLVNKGANVNIIVNRGETPFTIAANWGDEKIVNFLLSVPGVDVNIKNENKISALEKAASEGRENIVNILLKVPGIQYSPDELMKWRGIAKSGELYEAAQEGDIGKMEMLLQQHAPLNGVPNKTMNSIEYYRNVPLDASINNKNNKAVKFLLEKGADPNIITESGEMMFNDTASLLSIAIIAQNIDAVKLLIEYGVNVSAQDLELAVIHSSKDIQELIKRQPTVNYNPKDLAKWKKNAEGNFDDSDDDYYGGGEYDAGW